MNEPIQTLRTFVVHVAERDGVLDRVVALLRRRAPAVESISLGRTHRPGLSRLTVVLSADEDHARRVAAHLRKLVDVVAVEELGATPSVRRELALIKVLASPEQRGAILQLAEHFRARSVDVAPDSLILEITGAPEKIAGLVAVLRPFGILEMAQGGTLAMTRGRPAFARAAQDPVASPATLAA